MDFVDFSREFSSGFGRLSSGFWGGSCSANVNPTVFGRSSLVQCFFLVDFPSKTKKPKRSVGLVWFFGN